MSEAFTPTPEVTDADVLTGHLQPDPSVLTDDECDDMIDAIFGDDTDDDSEADGE